MWYKSDNASKIKSKIIVVEGFDFTGKSYLIDKFSELYDYKLWEPSYNTEFTDKVIPYNDRYSLGIGLIDLVEKGLINHKLIISRGLVSGIVYNNMYHQCVPTMVNPEFYQYAKKKYSNSDLIHTVYITHTNERDAQTLYENSQKRSDNESYDKFNSFEEYMRIYYEFDKEFRLTLDNICESNYTILSSLSLKEVK